MMTKFDSHAPLMEISKQMYLNMMPTLIRQFHIINRIIARFAFKKLRLAKDHIN